MACLDAGAEAPVIGLNQVKTYHKFNSVPSNFKRRKNDTFLGKAGKKRLDQLK